MSSSRSAGATSFIVSVSAPASCCRILSGALVRDRTRLPGVREKLRSDIAATVPCAVLIEGWRLSLRGSRPVRYHRRMSRPPYIGLHVASGERRASAADIIAAVQREIASGGLPPGSRLPPVRALENQLGLSKNTAQAAYDELVARGLVEARIREGVFVLAPTRVAAGDDTPPAPLPQVIPPPLSRPDFTPRGVTNLSTVFIDPELLPTERI